VNFVSIKKFLFKDKFIPYTRTISVLTGTIQVGKRKSVKSVYFWNPNKFAFILEIFLPYSLELGRSTRKIARALCTSA
jgi:hypothetical protein